MLTKGANPEMTTRIPKNEKRLLNDKNWGIPEILQTVNNTQVNNTQVNKPLVNNTQASKLVI